MKHYTYYIIVLLSLFSACGNTEYEYSNEPCYLVFDNTASRSMKLTEAMNSVAPGTFCRISISGKTFVFETNTVPGKTESVNFNAIDERRTQQLGVYNGTGVIVGYGNLNNPPTFYAYDSQCPNCYKSTNLAQYALTMDTSGHAKCSKCGRTYDMNNGGIVSSGDGGDKMMRYRATTTGPQGVLTVSNK